MTFLLQQIPNSSSSAPTYGSTILYQSMLECIVKTWVATIGNDSSQSTEMEVARPRSTAFHWAERGRDFAGKAPCLRSTLSDLAFGRRMERRAPQAYRSTYVGPRRQRPGSISTSAERVLSLLAWCPANALLRGIRICLQGLTEPRKGHA